MTTLLRVIDRLARLLDGIPGVELLDGPMLASSDQPRVLIVGFSDDGSGGDMASDAETYEGDAVDRVRVFCQAGAWHGDVTLTPLREELAAIVAEVESRIAADPSLGGLVLDADLGPDQVYVPEQVSSGARALLTFTVEAVRA